MRKRNKAITIRLSEQEYLEMIKLVKQSGQRLQKYIIDASLKGQSTSADEVMELKNRNIILADIDRQLRGLGTNINQMARVANSTGIIPSVNRLDEIAVEVSQVKDEVREEWQLTRLLIIFLIVAAFLESLPI